MDPSSSRGEQRTLLAALVWMAAALASCGSGETVTDQSLAKFAIRGTVTGLQGTGLVLQNNAADDLAIGSVGAFRFVTPIPSGVSYSVTVKQQPVGRGTCTVNHGSGTVTDREVNDVAVICSAHFVSVGGNVSGLRGSGLVLQKNGGDDLPIAADGAFRFPQPVARGANYSVSVKAQPTNPSQTCTVEHASGAAGQVDVSDVKVSCSTTGYTVGGIVRGLRGHGLALQNNGGDDLAVSADGAFTFTQRVPSGADYAVTVKTQPTNNAQTCTVASPNGTVGSAPIEDVVVECPRPKLPRYAFVTNTTGKSISSFSIDPLTGNLVALGSAFAIGTSVEGIVATADGTRVYVAATDVNQVRRYDVSDAGALSANGVVAVGASPRGLALNPATNRLYVAARAGNAVDVIDLTSFTLIASVPVGTNPQLLTLHPTEPRLYVANIDTIVSPGVIGSISVIDTTTNTVSTTYTTTRYPSAIAVEPTGKFLYATNNVSSSISAVAIATGTEIGPFQTAGNSLFGIAANPVGRFIYVARFADGIVSAHKSDEASGLLTSVGNSPAGQAGPRVITVDPSGSFVYVANGGSNSVMIFETNYATGVLTTVGTVSTGAGPFQVALAN